MKINDIARQSLLYDFYGALLTKRQREVMELYNDENLSLAEIASEFGISRQGVYDALKNGAKAWEDYESKLGLVKKFSASSQAIDEIDRKLDTIIDRTSDEGVIRELKEVKSIIDNLEE